MKSVPLRQTLTLILIFVVVSIGLVALDRQGLVRPLRDGLAEVIDPIANGFQSATNGVGGTSDLEAQLATVTAERDQLNAENSQLKQVEQENETLRQQAELEARSPGTETVPATIIGSDPTGQQKFFRINRGSADGLEVGMAVVDPNYYVGQISEVEEHSAIVTLIIDTSMKVGARLEDSQAAGTVIGQWQSGGALLMEHIDKAVMPKEGEKVVTSDLTRNIPAGLIIGVVYGDPVLNAQNDQVEVQVRPACNFDSLDMVFVITNYEQN